MIIQLEITRRCNRACPECITHSNLFPWMPQADSDMTIEQIERLIGEVKENRTVQRIRIMGGEPLVHPQVVEVSRLLHKELLVPGHIQFLDFFSNGDGITQKVLRALPPMTIKLSRWKHHNRMLVAPKDTGQSYRVPCKRPSHCGVCLNAYGYWPCAAGGSVAKLFQMHQYVQHKLPTETNAFGDLTALCELCQMGAKKHIPWTPDCGPPSKSFVEAIERYKAENPEWKRY